MKHTIYHGDTLKVLKTLPDESVDCIITSPPYWGLRDYGEAANTIWDGDPDCEHEFEIEEKTKKGMAEAPEPHGLRTKLENIDNEGRGKKEFKYKSGFCKKCGAWYGQLGLEPTLDLYLKHLLQITAELNRVLKKTGVMFWNHGDCYQDKSLAMQNYRLILKMLDQQGDKWYLRNIIIWAKPNHMPSSVKDRFTNAYEPVFMLTKSKKYWFDLDAVRVPQKEFINKPNCKPKAINKGSHLDKGAFSKKGGFNAYREQKGIQYNPLGKNPGDLWTIPTQPFPEAHFATFPEKLVEPIIKAGCPQWICKKCGKARVRIIEEKRMTTPRNRKDVGEIGKPSGIRSLSGNTYNYPERQTIGWTDCKCREGWKAGVVLDPFLGSGTTMVVAEKLNRNSIGIELNPDYIEIAKKRMKPFLGQMRINGERTELKIVEAIKNER